MVGGTPKPFACTQEGCPMTFTTEDHLNVHQKKHEMDLNLNLGNKTNIFVADQTPTPTRFLRNCEEVGLFQDLQNVNPFEETFRRAVELVKTGSLPEPNLPADDTLHTPHVFPLLPDDNNIYVTQNAINHDCKTNTLLQNNNIVNETVCTLKIINNNSKNNVLSQDNNIINEAVCSLKESDNEIQNPVTLTSQDKSVAINSPDHDYALEAAKKNGSEVHNLNVTNTNLPTKLKLKQVLLKNKKPVTIINNIQPQTVYLMPVTDNKTIQNPVGINSDDNDTVSILSSSTTSVPILPAYTKVNIDQNIRQEVNKRISKNRYRRKSSDGVNTDIDIKKIDMLERNRAAALRCREKRKKWIKNLENKYGVVCQVNQNLQKEVTNLRNEILQLKTLLLAHKDCSVTKAMNSGQKIVLEPSQIVNVSVQPPNKKLCPVILKQELQNSSCDKSKIPKLIHTLDVKDISFVTTQTKKSVIVVNTAYNDLTS